MKHLLFLLLITTTATAQSYSDSAITIKGTQRLAWWVTKGIQINAENRKLPDVLKPYVGSGNDPDSTFTVTMKAGILQAGIELLLTRPLLVAYTDYRSIILGQPAITGYTTLNAQLTTIANGTGPQKLTAQWLLAWYTERVKNFTDLYNEEKTSVIKLVQ